MTDWTEITVSATSWALAQAEVHRRFGARKYGIGAFGQGGISSNTPFQEEASGG